MRRRRRALAALAPALALAAAPAAARGEDAVSPGDDPVGLELGPLFARGPVYRDHVVALRVRLENRTGGALDGELALTPSPAWAYPGDGATAHRVAVPLPPRAVRTVVVPVPVDGAARVHATYAAGGDGLARVAVATTHRNFALGLALWPSSPALRTAIEGVAAPPPPGRAPPATPPGAHGPYALGDVRRDARSGDPELPRDAVGWGWADAVVASVPAYLRATDAERRALDGWVRAGGHLVLSPRAPGELDRPELRTLLDGAEETRWGSRRARGFGAVHALALDVTDDAALAFEAATVPLLGALLEAVAHDRAGAGPVLSPLGRTAARVGTPVATRDARLQAGLDPNQRYRQSLGLVALLLAVYVVALATFGAGGASRGGAPLRVLVRTPALALGFTAAFLAIGYVGKGLRSQQLRFELVESPSGAPAATARRYTALFPTRPMRFDWTATTPAARFLAGDVRLVEAVRHEAGAGPRFEGVRAGLWETRFVREDRLPELGGAVTLVADGRGRVRAVDNGLPVPLADAVVVTPRGWVVPVGDVPAGGRVAVDRPARFAAGAAVYPGDPRRARFARLLGLGEARWPLVDGLFAAHPNGERAAREREAALYARLPASGAPSGSDRFTPVADLRLLRVSLAVPDAPPRGAPGATMPVPTYPAGSRP